MADTPSLQGADVHLPPPLIYAAPLAAAWAVDRLLPWRMPVSKWRAGAGLGLLATGLAVSAAGAASFRTNGTPVVPGRPAATMVTSGPYVYTRNPMYVGMTVAYVGGSLLLGTWWAPAVLPAIVAVVDRKVIRREEAYLRSRFGEQYDQFCRHTRRWV